MKSRSLRQRISRSIDAETQHLDWVLSVRKFRRQVLAASPTYCTICPILTAIEFGKNLINLDPR
jgi:hypothetical protein